MREIKEKKILMDSPEAAEFVENIKGWVSSKGLFYGNNKTSECLARFNGCTHRFCENCGEETAKSYKICPACREKRAVEKYNNMPRKKYSSEYLYSDAADRYFADYESMVDYCEAEECTLESLRLIICEPSKIKEVDADCHLEEIIPDDGELPQDIYDAFEELNCFLRNYVTPISYIPGENAADFGINLNRHPTVMLHLSTRP